MYYVLSSNIRARSAHGRSVWAFPKRTGLSGGPGIMERWEADLQSWTGISYTTHHWVCILVGESKPKLKDVIRCDAAHAANRWDSNSLKRARKTRLVLCAFLGPRFFTWIEFASFGKQSPTSLQMFFHTFSMYTAISRLWTEEILNFNLAHRSRNIEGCLGMKPLTKTLGTRCFDKLRVLGISSMLEHEWFFEW